MEILIVEDAADIRAYLKALLMPLGWRVYEAADGTEACNILRQQTIKVVLTDWMMPGMDGIELIRWIRNHQGEHYIYTILLTSRDQENDIVTGLTTGADDFMIKPVSKKTLVARLHVAQRIQLIQQNLILEQQQLRQSRDLIASAHQSIQSDLEQAADIQRALLPTSLDHIDNISVSWRYQPAQGISGDHLDILQTGSGHLGFYLLDVSGHGVGAALRSAAISQLLHPVTGLMHDINDVGPGHVLTRLNAYIVQQNPDVDYMVTMVLGLLNPTTGELRIASAGHPPPIVVPHNDTVTEIDQSGMPVGIEAQVEYKETCLTLNPDTTLLLYSDGLTECANQQGKQFGRGSLIAAIEGAKPCSESELVTQIEAEVDNWRGFSALRDDLSMLAIRYQGTQPNQHQGSSPFTSAVEYQ